MRRLLVAISISLLLAAVALAACAPGEVARDAAPDNNAGTAPDTLLPATVAYLIDEHTVEILGQPQIVQTLELAISAGARQGEIVQVEHGTLATVNPSRYQVGDRVYLRGITLPDGEIRYDIATRDRSFTLLWMALVFVGLVVLAGQQRGARSLLGMGLSFIVIFGFVLPRVTAGQAPVLTALLGCALTMPVSYYLSHGLNRKTTIALGGSLLGLALTGGLAVLSVWAVGLTGFATDEAGFVQSLYGSYIDLQGLLLAGMIIGVLGVLDDVTVAQSATVEQLHQANRTLDTWQLYRRAMSVGQDHIASMVNTLVLVYAGASLPLLLLLTDQSLPLAYLISQEVVAEEIVRMLVTSIGLIASVPITTFLAARLMAVRTPAQESADETTSPLLYH